MIFAAIVVSAALVIFGVTCVYASWEERIDRVRRQHEHNREALDLANEDYELPPEPARERELAG